MKRITSLAIVLTLLLGSITTVFAADLDLINQVDDSKNFSWNEFVRVSTNLRYVGENIDDYLIEFEEQFYRAAQVDAAIKAGAENFEEAIKELEPVEKPIEELEVVEVSAIDNTGVEVVFKEGPEEDLDDVTIEVVDNEGNVVEVKGITVAAEETTVFFEFVTPYAVNYEFKGVWSFGGFEVDFDLIANLDAFREAGDDQIALRKALADLGIKNVKVENMPDYAGGHKAFLDKLVEDKEELTVEAIQAWVDKVNADLAERQEKEEKEAAAVKAVKDAGENDVLLKAALEEHFDRVNPEWFGKYKSELTPIIGDEIGFDDIQGAINDVNNKEVLINDTANYAEVDRAELLKAKALIEEYATPTEKGELSEEAKKSLKAIDIQLAIVDVREASTPTRLKNALTSLDDLLDKNDKFMENIYKDENANYYFYGIEVGGLGKIGETEYPEEKVVGFKDNKDVKVLDHIKGTGGILENVNVAVNEYNEAVKEAQQSLNDILATPTVTVVDDIYNSTAKGDVRRLGYGVKGVPFDTTEDKPTIGDTESIVVELYKGKTLLGKQSLNATGYEKHSDKKSISGTIDAYGEYVSTSWDNEWYGELTDKPDTVKVTVKFKDTGKVAEKEFPLTLTSQDMQPFYLELVNGAETVEEMDAALLKLAEIEEKSYLNVPKADRLYVAEQVLEARNEIEDTKKFATYTDLTNALTGDDGVITKYNADLKAVNNLKETDSISVVIEALSFDEGFAKMSVADKAEIAEAFFLGLEFDEEGNLKTPFRTLAAVKEAAGL